VLPEAEYEEHAARGESENRNKELKHGRCADRLSDRRFLANFVRLNLHTTALNLLMRLRRAVTKAPAPRSVGIMGWLPAEALRRSPWKSCQSRTANSCSTAAAAKTRGVTASRVPDEASRLTWRTKCS
jgi:hypothetical protein